MSEELYNRALLEAAKAAIRAGRLAEPHGPGAYGRGRADNPLCGDRVTLEVRLAGGRIADLAHEVRGCALAQAAASVLGSHAPGPRPEDVAAVHRMLGAMLDAGGPAPGGAWATLEAFKPVARHPSRHGCVLLPFEALEAALAQAQETAP